MGREYYGRAMGKYLLETPITRLQGLPLETELKDKQECVK
jgi:hypothetical protein